MLPSSAAESPLPKARNRSTLMIALAVQGAVLLLTLFVMVREEPRLDPPAFEGERSARVERSEARRADKVRELQRRMSRPRSFQRLAVEDAFRSDLPPAPSLPEEAFDFDSVERSFMDDAHAATGDAGLASLIGGLAGRESAAEFFGVRDTGRRIVIVVNTSASVVRKAASRGVSIEQLQEEAAKLVEGLDSGTLFGIVQFSQGVRAFGERLAPALVKNKRLAGEWIRSELRGNPTVKSERYLGHEAGFWQALQMQPDLIFLVTDGSLNRRTPKAGGGYSYPKISFAALVAFIEGEMRRTGASPRLHVVGFELGEAEREGLSRLATRFGGTLREM